jgi:hypothetical protein
VPCKGGAPAITELPGDTLTLLLAGLKIGRKSA